MAQLKAHNEFLPPPTPGLRRSLALALVVHALLVIALAYVVPWHLENSDSPPFTAELWTTPPSGAASLKPKAPITPPAPKPAPPPPAPAPPAEKSAKPIQPVPKVVAPAAVQSPKVEAEIALKAQKQKPDANAEDITKQVRNKASTAQDDKQHKDSETPKPTDDKARKELEASKAAQDKLRKELEASKAAQEELSKKLEASKAAQEERRKESEAAKAAEEKQRKESEAAKAAQEKQRKESEAAKAAQEKQRKESEAAKAAEVAKEAQSEKLRKDQLERTMKQVPGTGTGAQTGPPGAEYGAKVRDAIRPNLLLIKEVSPNLKAEYLVKTVANGKIVDAKLTKSSGDTYFDDVALKAILKTERLPPDKDGKVPSPMVIVVSP
jgi:colicin import membrane protein